MASLIGCSHLASYPTRPFPVHLQIMFKRIFTQEAISPAASLILFSFSWFYVPIYNYRYFTTDCDRSRPVSLCYLIILWFCLFFVLSTVALCFSFFLVCCGSIQYLLLILWHSIPKFICNHVRLISLAILYGTQGSRL